MTDQTTPRTQQEIKNEYMTACAQLGETRYNIESFTAHANQLLSKIDGLRQELKLDTKGTNHE